MVSVSIQELKRRLSELIRMAEEGQRVLITRHKKPVAYLDSAELQHLHMGGKFGKARLKSVLRHATRGAYLRVVGDDRGAGR